MRSIGIFLVLAACNVSSPAAPDAPGGPGDGPHHGLGMFVSWNASPMLPGTLTDKISVMEATFQLDHFQIVADAGSVTRTKYLLAWNGNDAPKQDMFPDAPPGVYSKITLSMMGGSFGDDAFEIRGMWQNGGPPKNFVIHDDRPLNLSIDCNATLAAAGSATIAIKVDLKDAISKIAFQNLNDEDGVLELKDGKELSDFRSRLQDAFELDN